MLSLPKKWREHRPQDSREWPGLGGYTISESDSLSAAYADVLAYSEYMTFSINPIMKIDDAVGPIFEYLG
ncbi:MAG: DUF3303 family protein [Acidimicrobiales bacterium]